MRRPLIVAVAAALVLLTSYQAKADDGRWDAYWIAHPSASLKEYGVFHLRRTFDLDEVPGKFPIRVSADNRYILFVNGTIVCDGPSRGDLSHWRYESVDLAPFLRKGRNVVAALNWNMGEHVPYAQATHQTAFILEGLSELAKRLNTDQNWRIHQNTGYFPLPVEAFWFAAGCGDRVNGSVYPWGWAEPEFDDSNWQTPRRIGRGVDYGHRNFSMPWALVPRGIPPMESRVERLREIDRTTLEDVRDGFVRAERDLVIPADSEHSILLDHTFETMGYPVLRVSRGRGSRIRFTYAEALVDAHGEKGHRDEIENRRMIGLDDVFLPDGGEQRTFRPLWLRAFRYIQVEVQTDDEPLVIHDLHNVFTAYPYERRAEFDCSDPALQRIWDVGWRTMRLCAGETYFDCPYYEQLQYVGDTRVQALITLYLSPDDRLTRKAILQFNDSRIPEGLTLSRFPTNIEQIIPPFSLYWIIMVHDYWMHRDDPEFVGQFLHGIEGVLEWFERHRDGTGMLGPLPWWNFADWTPDFGAGEPPGVKTGHSALITLQYAYALQHAADLFEAFDNARKARDYRELAESITGATMENCWHESRGLLADTAEEAIFSQQTNSMAVLTGCIPSDEQKAFIERVAADQSITQCSLYFRFYLLKAMKAAGCGNRYLDMLGPWHNMLGQGLTTFAEKEDSPRSDCHAWNAAPIYEFLATVCGIEPNSPGFRTVRIEPHPGDLTWIRASMPHPKGEIRIALKRSPEGTQTEVSLPSELRGTFVWEGEHIDLHGGAQRILLPD